MQYFAHVQIPSYMSAACVTACVIACDDDARLVDIGIGNHVVRCAWCYLDCCDDQPTHNIVTAT